MLVKVALLNQSFFQTLRQRHKHLATLQVSTIQHGIDRSTEWILMRLVLTLVIEVVDGIAVSQHDGIVAPLVTQNVDKQAVARTTRLALKTLVGTHHLTDVGLFHQCLKGRQISLPQVTIRGLYIHRVAQGFRTAMYCIVFGTGMRLKVAVVISLHTQYGLYTQHRIHIGILATGFLTTSPAWVAEDVDIWTPERQLRITRIVGHTLWHVEQLRVVVVSAVPVGTGLVAHLREDVVHQLRIEGCRHTDGLWIDGIATLTHAMTGLAPPVVAGNAETIY